MSCLITYLLVDCPQEMEEEFEDISEAKKWLLGRREEDFLWLELSTDSCELMATSYSEVLEF